MVFLKSVGSGARVQTIVSVALGAVLLVAVAALLLKMYLDHRNGTAAGVDEKLRVKKLPTLAIGASIGFIVGITSVGSGTLVIILLLFLYPRLRGSQMVGTDLAQAIPMVGSAAIAHIIFGDFKLGLTLSILIGSIPGVLIGASDLVVRADRVPPRCAGGRAPGVRSQARQRADALASGSCCSSAVRRLGAAWLSIRASGRTLREISGETPVLAGTHRDFAEEPALQTAGSLSEA